MYFHSFKILYLIANAVFSVWPWRGSVISVELVVDSWDVNISIVYTMSYPNTFALTGSCDTLLRKRTAYFGYKRATELLEGQSVMICTAMHNYYKLHCIVSLIILHSLLHK